jgi:hypothetical protein
MDLLVAIPGDHKKRRVFVIPKVNESFSESVHIINQFMGGDRSTWLFLDLVFLLDSSIFEQFLLADFL